MCCKSLGPVSKDGTIAVRYRHNETTESTSTVDVKNVLHILDCTCCNLLIEDYEICAVPFCPRRVCKPKHDAPLGCIRRSFKIMDHITNFHRYFVCNDCWMELFANHDSYVMVPYDNLSKGCLINEDTIPYDDLVVPIKNNGGNKDNVGDFIGIVSLHIFLTNLIFLYKGRAR